MKKIEELKPFGPQPSATRPTAPVEPDDRDDETLLPSEVAELLKVSQSFLAKGRMRDDGPPYHKVGRAVRYTRSEVLAWLKSRGRNSTSED
jgi:predicted DNA-binding transcriptional regulator AlpA